MKIEGSKFFLSNIDEHSNVRYFATYDFNPSKVAMVLIDVWASHPNIGWMHRAGENVVEYLSPVLQSARACGMTIIHAPTGAPEHPLCVPIPGEFVVPNETQPVVDILVSRGIEVVFYCGYAANMCLIFKPTGLYHISRHQSMAAMKFVILSDATIGYENSETFADETLKRAIIQHMTWSSLPSIASTNEQFFAAAFPKMNWNPSMPMKASLNCNGTTLTLTAGSIGGVEVPANITLPATGLTPSTGYHIHLQSGALHLDAAAVVVGAVRLGCMSTDANGALLPFMQIGKEFCLKNSLPIWNAVDVSTYSARRVAPVPAGLKLKLDVTYASKGSLSSWVYLRDPDLSLPKLTDNAEAVGYHLPDGWATGRTEVWSNDTGYIIAHDRTGPGAQMTLSLHGWTDLAAGTVN